MTRQKNLFVAIVILLAAAWLRFHNLDAQSFWNDEGNSARLSERSLRLIIEGTASDVHPPLYYFVLRGWRELVGESEFALRSVSAFAGVLIVALMWPFASLIQRSRDSQSRSFQTRLRIAATGLGAIAALFVAVNPASLYYSQEARMYTLLPLWALLGTVLLLQITTSKLEVRNAVSYILVMAAGLYTHYFFPIVFAIHGMILLPSLPQRNGNFWRWLGLAVAAGLLFVPWLPNVLNGVGGNRGVGQGFGRFLNGAIDFVWLGLPTNSLPFGTLLLLLAAIGFATRNSRSAWWLLVLALLPLFSLGLIGATDAEFYKFLLLSVPPLALGLALLVQLLWQSNFSVKQQISRFVAVLLVGFVIASSWTHWQTTTTQFVRDDYRGIAETISAENHPAAAVLLNAPNQWEVFTYYHQEGAPVYPIPRQNERTATVAELEQIAVKHDRLYALYWGDTQQDPEHWVENWLNENSFKASEEWVGDVRFVRYALPSGALGEPKLVADQQFGGQIELVSYAHSDHSINAGNIIELRLQLRAIRPIDQRYKLFVHLLNAEGQLIAQKDVEPTPFTFDWAVANEQIINVGIPLPFAQPSGSYRLVLGWYDVLAPQTRLLLPDGSDNFPIATFEVVE